MDKGLPATNPSGADGVLFQNVAKKIEVAIATDVTVCRIATPRHALSQLLLALDADGGVELLLFVFLRTDLFKRHCHHRTPRLLAPPQYAKMHSSGVGCAGAPTYCTGTARRTIALFLSRAGGHAIAINVHRTWMAGCDVR